MTRSATHEPPTHEPPATPPEAHEPPSAAHGSPAASSVTELTARVDRVVGGVAHWTLAAWSAAAPGAPERTRADVLHDLVQRLADLAADAEGRPRRPVPRLDNDLALPDQLRVVAADLRAATPPPDVLAAAVAAATATHRILWP